jgi:hypothetical protein
MIFLKEAIVVVIIVVEGITMVAGIMIETGPVRLCPLSLIALMRLSTKGIIQGHCGISFPN